MAKKRTMGLSTCGSSNNDKDIETNWKIKNIFATTSVEYEAQGGGIETYIDIISSYRL